MSGPNRKNTAVAPGNYDGVHLGHRALIAAARAHAGADGEVCVLTFDPHPAQLLAPERAPALLTTIERRRELLLRSGADRVEVLAFDHARAAQSPDAFVDEVLVAQLGASAVVVGPDFRFGAGAAGDVAFLRRRSERAGFVVEALGPIELGGSPMSSTRVRAALQQGDVAQAHALLGRLHDVGGVVVEGDRRGRTIGFPTANLDPEPVLLPADGVYAVLARVGAELVGGVANLGVRPTFAAGRSCEVHLFDFDRDIYGQTVRVAFAERLRGEQKFDGLEALVQQIGRDAAAALEVLETRAPEPDAWI